jgi:hypothetical protein
MRLSASLYGKRCEQFIGSPNPPPTKERPFIPALERTGLSGPFTVCPLFLVYHTDIKCVTSSNERKSTHEASAGSPVYLG